MADAFDAYSSYEASMHHLLAFADGLSRTIRIAHALVQADREIALDGLQNPVGLLCARALDLPPALGRGVHDRLLALRADMDALITAMDERIAPAPAHPAPAHPAPTHSGPD